MATVEQRVCGTLCICQMTAVLSGVALIYLSVAIYMPLKIALELGMVDDPIMCTTIQATDQEEENCEEWQTCREWCLSKASGQCMQVYVRARNNGTNVRFEGCTDIVNKYCTSLDLAKVETFQCFAKGTAPCKNLDKIFKCEQGTCKNITSVMSCHYSNAEQPVNCKRKRYCIELDGLYDCADGFCSKLNYPVQCERRCVDIPSGKKNLILMVGDLLTLANCQKAVVEETGVEFWNREANKLLVASCTQVKNVSNEIHSVDCVNGTLFKPDKFGDKTNYTVLLTTFMNEGQSHKLDPSGEVVAYESEIMIYNRTRLKINTEGCVDTLSSECISFFDGYGKDGRNYSAPARFPCYYTKKSSNFVVARYNREGTVMQLMVAACLPSSLFIVSCFCLFLCAKIIVVDDEAKWHVVVCADRDAIIGASAATQEQAMAL